jgi:glutamate 5-kinase
MGVIPIVNENDTLAVAEIKFGDNDTLSAITAAMIHADLLFLMTDVDCLYDKNPRTNPDARPIEVVQDISALEADGKSPMALPGNQNTDQEQSPALAQL